jgi:uncharacterized membrane protein
MTTGARIADAVAAGVGSWPFVIIQSLVLVARTFLNVVGWVKARDPQPLSSC